MLPDSVECEVNSCIKKYCVCSFGTYKINQAYSRNMLVYESIINEGWKVFDCRSKKSLQLRERIHSFRNPLTFIGIILKTTTLWVSLCIKQFRIPDFDIILVGYPSHLDVFPAKFIGWIRRKPVVIDAFYGLYNTIVEDRKLVSPESLPAKLVYYWEKYALSIADGILMDTDEQVNMLLKQYNLPPDKVFSVPVGIDESVWMPIHHDTNNGQFRVVLWSTFIPLHGVEVVAEAARLLLDFSKNIKFIVIGEGQVSDDFSEYIKKYNLTNVDWIKKLIPVHDIYDIVKTSNCCLGIFSKNKKADRVVPYKVYQTLASSRPLITADTTAVRKVLVNGESAILVPPGSPTALAAAIRKLSQDVSLQRHLSRNGRIAYEKKLSNNVMQEKLVWCLRSLLHKDESD